MRISILGTGHMAKALAGRWAELGHDIFVAGRTIERAHNLASEIGRGARACALAEATAHADIVLLAVLYPRVLPTLIAAGAEQGAFVGKTIIDCNNPVEVDGFSVVTAGGTSLAEQISLTARGASVVKAFHLCHASVWDMAPPVFDGRTLSVPICGNEPASKAVVGALIEEMGCRLIDLGPLIQARNLEPMAAVIIKVLHEGAAPSSNFNLVAA